MASPWTDESAIMRDLSFAQGRWVPGDIDVSVAGANPPTLNITEETEEEYFQRWTTEGGTGDFAGPDLIQIKTMLELMQEEEAPKEEEILSGPIEIRKYSTPAALFVLKNKNITKENIKPKQLNKPRRARNVAIASILSLTQLQEPLKLAKPEDFIKPTKEDEEIKERRIDSVNKVTNWLQSQDITSMFKKKTSVTSLKDDQKNSEKDSKSQQSPAQSSHSVKSGTGVYTPSSWAEEYYRKAVNRTKLRDLMQDDIWGRAEKAMKEIDAKKEEERKQQVAKEWEEEIVRKAETFLAGQAEGVQAAAEGTVVDDDEKVEGLAHIFLAAPRHTLFPGACVVCAACAAPAPASASTFAPATGAAPASAPASAPATASANASAPAPASAAAPASAPDSNL